MMRVASFFTGSNLFVFSVQSVYDPVKKLVAFIDRIFAVVIDF